MGQRNYTSVTSLEHRTLIQIAATLWNVNDVENFVSRFYSYLISSRKMDGWLKLENKIIEKKSKLPLPNPLKHKVLCFIRPVGLQILEWLDFQYHSCRFVTKLPTKFFWTSQGTMDKQKTAEVLVNDESLSIYVRYKMACIYCLEDHIHILWKQLLNDTYEIDLASIRIHEPPLVSFWSHYLEGEIAQLDHVMKDYCGDNVTPYEYAFSRFAESGNEAATRYFLKKLNPEEKEKTLVKTTVNVAYKRCNFAFDRTDFHKEFYTNVLCFLLLQSDEEQQKEVLKNYSFCVLKCFLDWPWQSFFMKTAEHSWDFLSEEDYYSLLRNIIDNTFMKDLNFNYQELLREFWLQSPSVHKKYIINECTSSGSLVCDLFVAEDEESIKLVFKYAVAEERQKFIFYGQGRNICRHLILNRKLCLLKFFVREFLSTEDIIIRFKEEFRAFIAQCLSKDQLEKANNMFNTFFQLLDDLVEKYDEKSNGEESDSSSAKRHCSLTSGHPSSFKEIFKE